MEHASFKHHVDIVAEGRIGVTGGFGHVTDAVAAATQFIQ
jgi:hypothetical protein